MDHELTDEDLAAFSAEEKAMINDIARLLKSYKSTRSVLIPILQTIQERHSYIAAAAIEMVAEHLGMAMCEVYGVATFYHSFSLKPRGKHLVCVCLGTACHVRGAAMIVEELERQLGIKAGQTTPDGEFTLETANCLGACAIGPVVTADGRYFSKVDTTKVKAILEKVQAGLLEDEESLAVASDG